MNNRSDIPNQTTGNSRCVSSNQNGPHPKLEQIVKKHLRTRNLGRLRTSTADQFETILEMLLKAPLLLDSGCGTAASSSALATAYPDYTVLGIDKSLSRLTTGGRIMDCNLIIRDNLILLRADCSDVWRLLLDAGIVPLRHFLLYPNPWPKSRHMKRRWHGHPSFRTLIELGGQLELRTNWEIYCSEFHTALKVAGHTSEIELISQEQGISTPFERKYLSSGQTLYRLVANLNYPQNQDGG